ncbi:MAG: hypothetical protein D6680_07260 [Cyanobacteria bacterium J007]|nr:MAG: hypothetical protein D6680_07260 [Cyanobacteria bacterium J007]
MTPGTRRAARDEKSDKGGREIGAKTDANSKSLSLLILEEKWRKGAIKIGILLAPSGGLRRRRRCAIAADGHKFRKSDRAEAKNCP